MKVTNVYNRTFAGWHVVKPLIRSALYNVRARQFVTSVALHPGLVSVKVLSGRVDYKPAFDRGQQRALCTYVRKHRRMMYHTKKYQRLFLPFAKNRTLTRTGWHLIGPGPVAHAEDHRMSASYVPWLALESHDRPVTSSTPVQNGYVRVRCFRKR